MANKPRPHGAALNSSEYVPYVVLWLQENPRLTSGKIRQRLIDQYGENAAFSEPHIRAWLENYYPNILRAVAGSVEGKKGAAVFAVARLTDSNLFGKVIDSLDYHQQMVQLLESRMKETEEEYTIIRKRIQNESTAPDEVVQLSRTSQQLRDQLIKFSNTIRGYKVYIDEWQRTHDFGERMGDILAKAVEAALDIFVPEITEEDKRETAIEEFKEASSRIGQQFKVPVDRLYG